MDVLPQASLFLGVIPALIIMYISIKGYENYYKDKNMFLSFVAGILMGFAAAFAQSFTIALSIIFIVALAFFDQFFKTVVLNIGRLQQNKETPIYGLSLGLGFGSSFTPFVIIAVSSLITNNAYVLGLITVASLGIILFHGGTGAYIGYGIFKGKLTKYLLISIILQLPFNLLIGLMIDNLKSELIQTQLLFVIIILSYGFFVFWYITKTILPGLITSTEKRKRSKK